IEGEVLTTKAAGKVTGRSELSFTFDKLILKGKEQEPIPIEADLTEIANAQGVSGVDEEGRAIGKSSVKAEIARTAVTSGAGAVIGGLLGGKGGAAKGALIGAAVALTINFTTSGPDIRLAPGSILSLTMKPSTERQPVK